MTEPFLETYQLVEVLQESVEYIYLDSVKICCTVVIKLTSAKGKQQ